MDKVLKVFRCSKVDTKLNSTNNKNIADNFLVIDSLPLKINEIIEKVNIILLKKKFNNQSEIKIDKFTLFNFYT